MTSAALNRRFTVSGSSTSTITGYTPHQYRIFEVNPSGAGRWGAGDAADWLADIPATVADLAAATVTRLGLAIEDVDGVDVPAEDDLTGAKVYLVDDRGVQRITWDVTSAVTIRSGFNTPQRRELTVANPVVNVDGDIDPAMVFFGFASRSVQVSATVTKDARVWGRQLERGSTSGVLSISAGGEVSIEARAATAQFRIRYDDALANPDQITDDLGRVWYVYSVASVQDRRFLDFETSRTVLA